MRAFPSPALAAAAIALLAACDTARELEPSDRSGPCAECHGFPPERSYVSGLPHPSDPGCFACHGTSVTPDGDIAPGGTHFDGSVDVTGHPHPFPIADHMVAARAAIGWCAGCHGEDYGGGYAQSCTACHASFGFGDWRTNCTFCHGTRTASWNGTPAAAPAPPQTVTGSGGQTSANPKVGAHQKHLLGGTYSAPLACGSCHAVPQRTFPQSFGHVDGIVAVQLSAMARQGVSSPGYAGGGGGCAVYCHGSTSLLAGAANATPAWTSTGTVACGSCHTAAPETGLHSFHAGNGVPCASCHPGTSVDPEAVNTATHVNGTFEASPVTTTATFSSWPGACTECHPGGPP